MKFCASCGARLQVGDAFCGSCGMRVAAVPSPVDLASLATGPTPSPFAPPPVAPPPVAPPTVASPTVASPTVAQPPAPMVDPPGARRAGTMVFLFLLAVLAIAAGVVLLVTRGDGEGAAGGTSTAPATTVAATVTTQAGTTVPAAPATIATTAPADPVAVARAELAALLAADQPMADSLQNAFVPQLSAKQEGLVIDGVTYGPQEILADHQALRAAHGAILVDAGRYQFEHDGARMTGWYLTIVPQTFPTRDAATQWCTDNGLGPDVCFGRTFQPLA